jgi:hypothetical protein
MAVMTVITHAAFAASFMWFNHGTVGRIEGKKSKN